jgi:hypothetical protein
MIGKRQIVIGLLVPLLSFEVSCHKKQAAASLKPPGPAPTIAQSLPNEIPAEPLPQNPAEQTAKAEEPPPLPKKSRPRKKPSSNASNQAKTSQPPATTTTSPQTSTQTTTAELHPPAIPANPAAEVAIGPDVSSAEAARDRQSTNQSLDTTEKDLKRLDGRSLSSDEQAMVTQIRAYISQSRKAITDGDYERASNLAKKAQLLTDELLKK